MVILAAIDETERSMSVATLAYDLAATYGDTLIALHVIPTEEYEAHKEAIKDIPEFRDYSIAQGTKGAEQFAREFVMQAIGDPGDVPIQARGRVGNVSDEIIDEADSIEPRFLTISGRRRSPAGKALFGNTAQKILLNVECPVVTKLSDD